MNTKGIAKHYDKLTPEECFRLFLAAAIRGDDAEQNRLVQAERRLTLSIPAHAPYAHAFHELLIEIYIDLLENAAQCLEYNALAEKEYLASQEVSRATKRKTPKPKRRTRKGDAPGSLAENRFGRMAYGAGFLFKMKFEGWRLFCGRLNVSAIVLWEQLSLPGLDRLESAWALIHAGAVFPSAAEMVNWVNEVRPAGDAEYTEANLMTNLEMANYFDAWFRERVHSWGR